MHTRKHLGRQHVKGLESFRHKSKVRNWKRHKTRVTLLTVSKHGCLFFFMSKTIRSEYFHHLSFAYMGCTAEKCFLYNKCICISRWFSYILQEAGYMMMILCVLSALFLSVSEFQMESQMRLMSGSILSFHMDDLCWIKSTKVEWNNFISVFSSL